jgi:hypothetical protein
MRADGWYWVRCEKWAESGIAYWKNESGGYWSVFGCDDFKDSDFTEIDETPIDREKRYGIKPLEWVEKCNGTWLSETITGRYAVIKTENSFRSMIWNTGEGLHDGTPDFDEAKQSCESHYREQVLKCLTN